MQYEHYRHSGPRRKFQGVIAMKRADKKRSRQEAHMEVAAELLLKEHEVEFRQMELLAEEYEPFFQAQEREGLPLDESGRFRDRGRSTEPWFFDSKIGCDYDEYDDRGDPKMSSTQSFYDYDDK